MIALLETCCILKTGLQDLLSQCIAFFAYPDRMITKLCPKDLFDEHDGLESPHIGMAKQMVEPPPHSLSGNTESLVYLFTVGSFQDHAARLTRLELHPQVS